MQLWGFGQAQKQQTAVQTKGVDYLYSISSILLPRKTRHP